VSLLNTLAAAEAADAKAELAQWCEAVVRESFKAWIGRGPGCGDNIGVVLTRLTPNDSTTATAAAPAPASA
jgi:hypothetical protein